MRSAGRDARRFLSRLLCVALVLGAIASRARAEEESKAPAQAEWKGTIRGQVFDGRKGTPVPYASVTLIWPAPADGGEARRQVQVADPNGAFEFPAIPAGVYTLAFSKTGYQASTLMNFRVTPEQLDRADFQLPPLPEKSAQAIEEVPDVEEFVVLGAKVEALEASRAESDELINTLSAEEFSKFAATDVADALKFVAGVNVVEGQFAIIRGLEDRYSSTLYNSAPIPSPDPDKQSVQLDLFASDIVSNLVVAKTFGPDLPSNSSAGSINILTHDYPEEIEAKFQGGSGFNEKAAQRFLAYNAGSPVGTEESGLDTIESDFSGSLGGRTELFGREIRFKAVAAREIDYYTAEGFQEGRQPRRPEFLDEGGPSEETRRSGSLAFGELLLTDGRFDLTESERTQQLTGYGGLGFDLDEAGNHRIDGSIFYTKKKNDAVELRENGYLPGFDYGPVADFQASEGRIDPTYFIADGGICLEVCATLGSWIAKAREGEAESSANRGPLWYANFSPNRSLGVERDLLVYQINGEHRFDALDGFRFTWAANKAKTTQSETGLAARIFYEPSNENQPGFVIPAAFPVSVGALRAADEAAGGLPDGYSPFFTINGIVNSANDIHEDAHFGRFDAEYEFEVLDPITVKVASGGWFEKATRGVTSSFLENPTVNSSSNFGISGATPEALGEAIFSTINGGNTRETTNDSTREIQAGSFGLKATLWDDLDLLGGLRVEDILIESRNQPYTGTPRAGAPGTFPDVYVFFDRLDNPYREGIANIPANATYNDQLLGIDVPLGPCRHPNGTIPDPTLQCVDLWTPGDPNDRSAIESLINGTIDELKILPAAGFAYRPIEGMSLRAAWSRTVARPSFREMGFYASVELGTDDLVVGNPQLTLSDVESWDARVEYTWGELGDLAALSGFYKTIERPIESIVVRNPATLEGNALWRTFFNNPNTAQLWGVELEARKNLGFFGPEMLEYLSLGGNFTYIHAQVDRSAAELARAQLFFQTTPDAAPAYFGLETSRRLFGQPEWIVNTDISFDQPDWGTSITLSVFAISDLLDAAGTAATGPDGRITSLALDRYIDSFYTMDLVFSQTFPFDVSLAPIGMEGTIPSALTFKTSIKNLTDSTRRIVYDPVQTSQKVAERSYKVGRDYSFSLTYSFAF
ncbi:MAG: TonB-dependent receptor domain-containing protein [Candidatus Limnocylindria bacterium]|jgi:outer membrane receptor protein involved in Fe transport